MQVCFLKIWKKNKEKVSKGFLRFGSMPFFNIWKLDEQKIVPGFIGLVSMLF